MIKQKVIKKNYSTHGGNSLFSGVVNGVEDTQCFADRVTEEANKIEERIEGQVMISYSTDFSVAIITYREEKYYR